MTDKEQLIRGDALAKVAALEAELAELRKRQVTEGYVPVPSVVVEFLKGAGTLEGLWFGESGVDRGAFWWRKYLLAAAPAPVEPFQQRVQAWMLECFGPAIAADRAERNHRFLEEALELVQSLGCSADEAHRLVDYVYGRPAGEPTQEVGGVMVTLAALCLANGLDMAGAGEQELARINQPDTLLRIREKQRNKPAMSPLPGVYPERAAPVERVEQEPLAMLLIDDASASESGDWDIEPIPAAIEKLARRGGATLPLYTTPQPAAPAALSIPEECPHMIVFDDADRQSEMFAGAGARSAALRRFEQVSGSWNAHLLVRIARNSRDDKRPCAKTAPAPDVAGLVSRIQDAAQAWYENTDDGLSKLLEVIEVAAHQRKEGV